MAQREVPILAEGGAAFVFMTMMGVHRELQSTGSLQSGAGTLVPRLILKFRGEASPSLKGLLQTAAGTASKIPLSARKMAVRYFGDAGEVRVQGKTSVIVVAGADADAAASLLVSVTCDPKPTDPDGDTLWKVHGKSGTVVLTPAPKDDGQQELLPEDGKKAPITIHGPAVDPVETTLEDLDDECGRVEFDVKEAQSGGGKKTAGTEPPKVKRRKGGEAMPN